jgi:hypothetical protein
VERGRRFVIPPLLRLIGGLSKQGRTHETFPSSGFHVVEPDYSTSELHLALKPITAFTSDDDDGKWVERITEASGDLAPPHPERLIRRPDGWYVDQRGGVGDEAAALDHFRNYQPRSNDRRQRWNGALLRCPLETDEHGRAYIAD